jgi:hypothetical protein
VVLLVTVAAVAAAAGYWFLYPQEVNVVMNYSPWLDGQTAAVTMDGQLVGKVGVPANQSCNMSVGCISPVGDAWLGRGLHEVRVSANGTTLLDRTFEVGGRTYAWVKIGNGNADFGVSDTPIGWAWGRLVGGIALPAGRGQRGGRSRELREVPWSGITNLLPRRERAMRSLMHALRMQGFMAHRAARRTVGGLRPPRDAWLSDPETELSLEGILAFCGRFLAEAEGERLVHELLVP